MISDDRHGILIRQKERIPALLNGQLVDIIVVFDNENPYGKVLGAQIRYDTKAETETLAKGLIDIVAGDKIDFLCDYYTYEGEYIDTYFLGEQYTATGEWKIENLHLGDRDYQMTYRITDIYNESQNTGKKEHEKNHGIDYRVGDETPNLKNNEKIEDNVLYDEEFRPLEASRVTVKDDKQ